MKKGMLLIFSILFLAVAGVLFVPFTQFSSSSTLLYIRTGENSKEKLLMLLTEKQCIRNKTLFSVTADLFDIWPRIKTGQYEIRKGQNLFQLIQMFRNNRQKPVDLIITKFRTPDQLASLIGKKFECDSLRFMQYLSGAECRETYQIAADQLFFITHPNTYTYYWSAGPKDILKKIYAYHREFWTQERVQQATRMQLTPLEITTLASIVEEETLVSREKPIIAGVYINRLKKDMPLGADPTVKFATGNFRLTRILLRHIRETAASPYNTYTHTGLPPGPICTPMDETIDAVLNAAQHDYLYFCAAPGYKGTHNFAVSDREHLQYARAYQAWLDAEGIR